MTTLNIPPTYALALEQAIRKGLNTKSARMELDTGVYHDINVTLEVHVDEMRVAPDTDKAPTTSIPLLPTCALLLKRMGIQREEALDMMREVMVEALDMGKDATQALLDETGVADMEKRLKEEVISKLPRVPVKGAVRVNPEHVRVTIKSMGMGDHEG